MLGGMPILVDFRQHKVFRKGVQAWADRRQARNLGMQIERRSGPLPDWGEQHLRKHVCQ